MEQNPEFDYKTLFDSAFTYAPIGMCFVLPNGKWFKVNKALCQMLGYSEEEFIQSDFQAITHPDDLMPDMLMVKMALRGDISNYKIEKRYFHKNGQILWAVLSVNLIRDENNEPKFFISQLQDITELKKAQLSLGHTSKMVALGEIAAGIAHEINNPLAVISLNVTAIRQLLQETPLNTEMISTFTDRTAENLKRITNIVNSLRKISRNSSAAFQLTRLDDIIDDALNLSLQTMKNKSIVLQKEIQEGIELECRPIELTQVLVNLLNNSIYSLENCPEKKIIIGAKISNDTVTLSVADSGQGIPLEIREKIMEPFFTTKPQGEGSGLGLSISHNIVLDHMGTFYLEEVKVGTKFVIELPQEQIMSLK